MAITFNCAIQELYNFYKVTDMHKSKFLLELVYVFGYNVVL